jgi:hypothetical protein
VTRNTHEHWTFLNSYAFAPHLLSDLPHQLINKSSIITEREHTIRIITQSRWWRLGAPVRWIMRRLKKS